MAVPLPTSLADGTLRRLEQLIDGLTAGVVPIYLTGAINWWNDAALAMHGVADIEGLGGIADEYVKRFALMLPNGQRLTASQPAAAKAYGLRSPPEMNERPGQQAGSAPGATAAEPSRRGREHEDA